MKSYKILDNKDTRSGFGVGLLQAGQADERVVALTADLKGSVKMDSFAKAFPDRFYTRKAPLACRWIRSRTW